VQATSAGAGEQVRAAGLSAAELARVTVTSAAGVHAGPLAEFCMLGLLAFTKDLPRLGADRRARRWDHWPMRELAGQTLLVVGLGHIGREVARQARALGMRVLGVKRDPAGPPGAHGVDHLRGPEALAELAAEADAVVITLPATGATRGLFDRALLARLRPGCVLVNVGRGAVVDEDALVDALRAGRLAGAALDVLASEPPPPASPLWELPNVLLSPHTAALSVAENRRIVELFGDNLRRFLDGAPLRNRVDTARFY
jgi:phosphoglycerate dehydrogenase-like enzyme